MNTDYAIKNRNNGKSTYHYKSTSNKTIFNGAEDNNRPQIKDLVLFKMAIAFGVEINQRQRIKWLFKLHGYIEKTTFRNNLERTCSNLGFVGKMNIDIGKDGRNNLLIIETPLFLFSLDNVVRFSNNLLAIAKQNPLLYERWEISPPKQTFSEKIKNLFSWVMKEQSSGLIHISPDKKAKYIIKNKK